MADICRKLGVSQGTFFRWKKTYRSLGVPELRELRQLREENLRLKQLLADLSLDIDPAGGARRRVVRPAEQRRAVGWARLAYDLSERRACVAVGVARSRFLLFLDHADDDGERF